MARSMIMTEVNIRKFSVRFFYLAAFVLVSHTLAAQSAILRGTITDERTGELLPFATVQLKGTSTGVVSDLHGEFILRDLAVGKQTFTISYVGYDAFDFEVDLQPGVNEYNPLITTNTSMMKEVVVTGQFVGQAAAINQQINSNTIMTVVSKDRIQELPDQNAAESVGRLPGIAIQRDGGEGQKVVVRGLSPRFNNITINGERIPSTDPQDRSVDLSFIAPEQLAGIEVFKALRPDMDADAIGGTVNFVGNKATESEWYGQVRVSGGYNEVSEAFGQPRFNASLGKRFLNDKLGVFFTGNYQNVDRDTEILDANYGQLTSASQLTATNLTLRDVEEDRQRFGSSLALDYDFGANSSLYLNSSWGETVRDEIERRRTWNLSTFREDFRIRQRERSTRVISNTLGGKHALGDGWEIDWLTSYSLTRQETPLSQELRFRIPDAFDTDSIPNFFELSIDEIPDILSGDINTAFVPKGGVRTFQNFTDEDVITARLDVKKAFALSPSINGFIKFGGKIRSFDRSNDVIQFRDTGNGNLDLTLTDFAVNFPSEYDLDPQSRILMSNFISGVDTDRSFLDDQFVFGPEISDSETRRFFSNFFNNVLARRLPLEAGDNENARYDATELISAGYVMAEVNIDKLMLMGGVRVERTDGEYVGFESVASSGDDEEDDEVNVQFVARQSEVYYANLFPMAHVRYKFTDWLDVRAAYTRTTARPNFQNWTPWVNFNAAENTLRRGNPNMRPTLANNYDVFISAYSNAGLFTIGFFAKDLQNIDVESTSVNPSEGVDFPGATVEEPIVISETSTVRGVEVDIQANFLQLPSPFDGMILTANFTFIDSETFYPVFVSETNSGEPFFNPAFENTLRSGSLPGQPDFTSNISFGYEKKGFSGRVSVIMQDQIFDELGPRAEEDIFTDFSTRWDATASQKIIDGLKVFANWNNITNEPQRGFIGDGSFPVEREFYGATFDLGLKYAF